MASVASQRPPLLLQRLDSSNDSVLYQRRRQLTADAAGGEVASDVQLSLQRSPTATVSSAATGTDGVVSGPASDLSVWTCVHCGFAFQSAERVLRQGEEAWHEKCFLCAQCFRPFPKGIFYEFDGRRFCEYDFSALFRPCCAKCGNHIVGRVIRALQASWHPDCFACQRCSRPLTDAFVKSPAGHAVCRDCSTAERKGSPACRFHCARCKDTVDETELLRHRGDNYHAYHFTCADCRCELTCEAREKDSRLYCVRCFDRLGVPVCARCRRPIDRERVVHAIQRTWHVEHFVCAACEKPFNGTRHFERRGLAYCEAHYQQMFGRVCFHCGDTIGGEQQCVEACGKHWCARHFSCTVCDRLMGKRSKFYEYDLKPVCKRCYQKFPSDLRKRLAKIHKQSR